MYKILALILTFFLATNAYPQGKYCTDTWGASFQIILNIVNLSFSKNNISNITADIFGQIISCDNTSYSVENSQLLYSKD